MTPVIINAKLHDWRIESSTDIKPTLNTFDGNMPDQPLLNKKAKVYIYIIYCSVFNVWIQNISSEGSNYDTVFFFDSFFL